MSRWCVRSQVEIAAEILQTVTDHAGVLKSTATRNSRPRYTKILTLLLANGYLRIEKAGSWNHGPAQQCYPTAKTKLFLTKYCELTRLLKCGGN